MSASCRRPGCTQVAAVAIHYDPVSCQLWLDPITVADRSAQTLCADHAERLSPPRGWVVVDRRGAQTTILAAPGVSGPGRPAERRALRRRWGSFEEPTLDFTASEAVTPAAAVVAESVAAPEPEPEVAVVAESVAAPESEPEVAVVAAPVPEPESEPEVAVVAAPVPEPESEPEVDPEATVASEPTAEPEPEPEPEPESTTGSPEDMQRLLHPRGGLLGRAFEATGHQRSVLTLPSDSDE